MRGPHHAPAIPATTSISTWPSRRSADILQRARDALPGSRQCTFWQCSRDLKKIVDQGLLNKEEAFWRLFDAAEVSAGPGQQRVIQQALRCLR